VKPLEPVGVGLVGCGYISGIYLENSRGLGVADMAYALRSGRPHRASGELTYHVLETMHAFHTASDKKRAVTLRSRCGKPAPLPLGLRRGYLDP